MPKDKLTISTDDAPRLQVACEIIGAKITGHKVFGNIVKVEVSVRSSGEFFKLGETFKGLPFGTKPEVTVPIEMSTVKAQATSTKLKA